MPVKKANTSVTVIGAWNPAIITPLWLSQYKVVDGDPQNLQPVFDHANQSMAFKINEKLVVSPDFNKLEVTAMDFSDCGGIIARILGLLQHTPVRAVITSFIFTSAPGDLPDNKLPTTLNLPGVAAVQSTFTRPIQDGRVQVSVGQQEGTNMVISVSIQRNASSASKAAEIAAGWSQDKDTAIGIVKEVFGADVP